MNSQQVRGKVGKFDIYLCPEQLISYAGVVLLQDFARQLAIERLLDEELRVKTHKCDC